MSPATISPRPHVDLYRLPPAWGPVVTLLIHPARASVLSVLLKHWCWFAGGVETKQRTNGSPNGRWQGARGGWLWTMRTSRRPSRRAPPSMPASSVCHSCRSTWPLHASHDGNCLVSNLRWWTTTGADRHAASRGRGIGGSAAGADRRAMSRGCPSDLIFSVASNHPRFFFANVTWSDGRV
jgi:hypothetical protein